MLKFYLNLFVMQLENHNNVYSLRILLLGLKLGFRNHKNVMFLLFKDLGIQTLTIFEKSTLIVDITIYYIIISLHILKCKQYIPMQKIKENYMIFVINAFWKMDSVFKVFETIPFSLVWLKIILTLSSNFKVLNPKLVIYYVLHGSACSVSLFLLISLNYLLFLSLIAL